jgi:uncharacterized coiled-coil DUF342 family protein
MLLEEIRDLKDSRDYDRVKLDEIADKMEALVGASTMWKTLRPVFELDEYIENLEYIAKDCDL